MVYALSGAWHVIAWPFLQVTVVQGLFSYPSSLKLLEPFSWRVHAKQQLQCVSPLGLSLLLFLCLSLESQFKRSHTNSRVGLC